jgi:hypothetical protein
MIAMLMIVALLCCSGMGEILPVNQSGLSSVVNAEAAPDAAHPLGKFTREIHNAQSLQVYFAGGDRHGGVGSAGQRAHRGADGARPACRSGSGG